MRLRLKRLRLKKMNKVKVALAIMGLIILFVWFISEALKRWKL
jgi:hypothetical protein